MLVQDSFGSCYSTYTSHILSGGLSQHEDLEGQFDFHIVGGPGGDLIDTFGRDLSTTKRRNAKRNTTRLSVVGGSDCVGERLPIGDLNIRIPADFGRTVLGDGYTYTSMAPQRSATANTNRPSTTRGSSTTSTSKTTRYTTVTSYSTIAKTCDGSVYPQPCFHYSSVIAGDPRYGLNTCKVADIKNAQRPLVNKWVREHTDRTWRDYIAEYYKAPNGKRKPLHPFGGTDGCQKDEWPPQVFQQGLADGYIRYLPGGENGGVANAGGSGWAKGFCNFPPKSSVATAQGGSIVNGVLEVVITTSITLNVHSLTWKNISPAVGDDDGLTANVCRPSVLTADVGYAVFTDDPWYKGVRIPDYQFPPGAKTKGKQQPSFKRDVNFLDGLDYVDGNMIVDEGNSTRRASREEIKELGYERCGTPDCRAELEILQQQQAELGLSTASLPAASASASATLTSSSPTTTSEQPGSIPVVHASVPTAAASEERSSGHLRHHRHRHEHQHGN
jgi:hypothetical protein